MNNINNNSNVSNIQKSLESKPILTLSSQVTSEIIQENNTPFSSIEEQKVQIEAKNVSFENRLVIDYLKKFKELGLIQELEYGCTLQEFIIILMLKSLEKNLDQCIEECEIFLKLNNNLNEDVHDNDLFKRGIPILFKGISPQIILQKICLPLLAKLGRNFFNNTLRELLNEKSACENSDTEHRALLIMIATHQLTIQNLMIVFYKPVSKDIYNIYMEAKSEINYLNKNVFSSKKRDKLILVNSSDKEFILKIKEGNKKNCTKSNELNSFLKDETVLEYFKNVQLHNMNLFNKISFQYKFLELLLPTQSNKLGLKIVESFGMLKLTKQFINQCLEELMLVAKQPQNSKEIMCIYSSMYENIKKLKAVWEGSDSKLKLIGQSIIFLHKKSYKLNDRYREIIKNNHQDKDFSGWFFNDTEAHYTNEINSDANFKETKKNCLTQAIVSNEELLKPKKNPPKVKNNKVISSKSLKKTNSLKNLNTDKKVPQIIVQKKNNPIELKSKVEISDFIKTTPITFFQDKFVEQNLTELCKDILSFNQKFTDEIKKSLNSQRLNAKLSESDFIKASKCSKELRDHFNYLSLNLNLFCKTVNSDLYALGAIIPFMCLSFHLVIEQHIKHGIIVKGLEFQPNHNLKTLCEFSNYTVGSDQQEDFIEDFKRAMIQIRYPITARDKIPLMDHPNSLKWTLFSKTLCENIILKKDDDSTLKDSLFELCNFLFDSYEQTIKCLLDNLEAPPEILSEALDFIGRLTKLKELLQSNITSNFTCLFETAIANKLKVSQKEGVILDQWRTVVCEFDKMRQDLSFTNIASLQPLEEAASHLLMLDSVDYLQNNYDFIEFAALHHRNSLIFQWILEQIYTFQGLTIGQIDFREIPHHDLMAYHYLTFPRVEAPLNLNEFNFGRALHYSHERNKALGLPLIQDLLSVRKSLKGIDSSSPEWAVIRGKGQTLTKPQDKNLKLKQGRRNNFFKGANLVQDVLKLVFEDNKKL